MLSSRLRKKRSWDTLARPSPEPLMALLHHDVCETLIITLHGNFQPENESIIIMIIIGYRFHASLTTETTYFQWEVTVLSGSDYLSSFVDHIRVKGFRNCRLTHFFKNHVPSTNRIISQAILLLVHVCQTITVFHLVVKKRASL